MKRRKGFSDDCHDEPEKSSCSNGESLDMALQMLQATENGRHLLLHGTSRLLSPTNAARRTNNDVNSLMAAAICFMLLLMISYDRLYCSPEIYLQSLVADSPLSGHGDSPHLHQIFDEFLLEQTDFPSPFNVAIFYNIFIPIDQGRQGIARALSIVQEQLDQIGTSFANDKLMSQTAARPSSPPLTIFYSTIGLSGAVTSSFMHHACTVKHGMRCLPLGRHHADGFEEHTLEPLHSFCQRQQHTAHKRRNVSNSISDARFKVIYLHSKGSFHRQRGENDVWRKHLTRAALSEKCLEYGISSLSNSCNVCGLLFYPLWTFFYPGNMWTADCEYVAKLVAPLTHRARLEQAVAATDFLNEINLSLSNWKMTLYETGPGYLGVGRYSSEHWIASHPDVVPCDLSRTARLEHWWEEHSERTANKESVFEKSLAPRHDIHSPYFRLNHSLLDSIVTNPSRADREYFLLTGFLHKWLTIYKQVPSSYSWVWKWFPNGAYWLQTYEKYGNDTVRVLLEGG